MGFGVGGFRLWSLRSDLFLFCNSAELCSLRLTEFQHLQLTATKSSSTRHKPELLPRPGQSIPPAFCTGRGSECRSAGFGLRVIGR